jgi:hypothetical protein
MPEKNLNIFNLLGAPGDLEPVLQGGDIGDLEGSKKMA